MLLQILLWIVVITAFPFFGSWYARRYDRVDALVGLFVAFVLISNIIAYKIATFDLGFITFYKGIKKPRPFKGGDECQNFPGAIAS